MNLDRDLLQLGMIWMMIETIQNETQQLQCLDIGMFELRGLYGQVNALRVMSLKPTITTNNNRARSGFESQIPIYAKPHIKLYI